jgi:hypothetical protein
MANTFLDKVDTKPIVKPGATKARAKFRLFCESCTGVAMFSDTKETKKDTVACLSCGNFTPVVKENWLPNN